MLLAAASREWFDRRFVPVISPVALIALLWTVFAIFTIQGHNIVDNIGDVCRVAVPMVVYFLVMFSASLSLCRWFEFGYEKAITQAFTASSNNFELAIAVAAGTFGVDSPKRWPPPSGPWSRCPCCCRSCTSPCGSNLDSPGRWLRTARRAQQRQQDSKERRNRPLSSWRGASK